MRIIFATHNENKLKQVKQVLKDFEVVGPSEIGITEEIEETANSYRGNAELKARAIHNLTKEVCIADDSGLSIDAFDGWPGVQTHRFLGENSTRDQRNDVILTKLKGIRNRDCTVICSICLIDKQGNVQFKEGTFDTEVALEKKGQNKFGFDEILIYKDGKTLAEVSDDEKLKVNARSVAITKLLPNLYELKSKYDTEKLQENDSEKIEEVEMSQTKPAKEVEEVTKEEIKTAEVVEKPEDSCKKQTEENQADKNVAKQKLSNEEKESKKEKIIPVKVKISVDEEKNVLREEKHNLIKNLLKRM